MTYSLPVQTTDNSIHQQWTTTRGCHSLGGFWQRRAQSPLYARALCTRFCCAAARALSKRFPAVFVRYSLMKIFLHDFWIAEVYKQRETLFLHLVGKSDNHWVGTPCSIWFGQPMSRKFVLLVPLLSPLSDRHSWHLWLILPSSSAVWLISPIHIQSFYQSIIESLVSLIWH